MATNTASHQEHTLKALHSDLDTMRQLVTCNICDRLLYQPFSISCGHTYCYSCLAQWLGNNAKMTCPDCRIVVKQQPTPSYVIRELVLVFASRSELLPDGETAEEHQKSAKEEAEIVAADKANTHPRTGGLFKGRFNASRQRGALHDPGDHVERCPDCHWEVEDGICAGCGLEVDAVMADDLSVNTDDMSNTEELSSDEEADHDLDLQDEEDPFARYDMEQLHRINMGLNGQMDGVDGDLRDEFNAAELDDMIANAYLDPGLAQERRNLQRVYAARATRDDRLHQAARRLPYPTVRIRTDDESSSSEDSSEEDEHDPEMDGFIDDEADEDDEPSEAESNGTARPLDWQYHDPHFEQGGAVVISDDEEASSSAVDGARHESESVSSDSESESESEDEGPISHSQRMKRSNVAVRPRRAVTVSSSSDSDDESDDTVQDTATGQGGFSPIDESNEDGSSVRTDYDDDVEAEDNDNESESSESLSHDSQYDQFDGGATEGYDGERFDQYEDEEESNDGWGIEQAALFQQPMPAPSHRLGTLGQRSNRHAAPANYGAIPRPPTFARTQHARPHRAGNAFVPPSRAPSSYPMPPRTMHEARHAHPFQLDNTLASINNTRNYNQRNQQARTHPHPRNLASGSGRSGGGVAVPSSSVRGEMTGHAINAARRKRGVSVSSDDSQDFYGI